MNEDGQGVTSTSRFMGLWVLGQLPISITWVLCQRHLLPQFYTGSTLAMFVLPHLLGLLLACAAAAIQSELLARHRRFLPRWMLATVLGSLAGAILSSVGSLQLLMAATRSPAMGWIYSIAATSTYAIAIAAAQGLVLWGPRWTPEWPLWAAGMLLVRAVPTFGLSLGFRGLAAESAALSWLWYVFAPLQGAMIAAGTAWMLDRLYFRPGGPEAQPGSPSSPTASA